MIVSVSTIILQRAAVKIPQVTNYFVICINLKLGTRVFEGEAHLVRMSRLRGDDTAVHRIGTILAHRYFFHFEQSKF